ncbi:hypothetical protein SAMN05892877_105322 [Rhizobium subbaraonis]|uniref:Transmembrane anchored protein n=1 Tax=Rhizobium subbaraonis TaxID=908946 RepID=A0A285UEA2_9HYPH|nr:hypothetical protein [Rhizobium subbaraonis]SOC38906.1 hypothetical protein SAMN05892877_105322 [Rhizobium subbaraonis]
MHAKGQRDDIHEEHLFSARFIKRLCVGIAVLAGLTGALSYAGRELGDRIALAGHTEDRTPLNILIGEDHLRLPSNAIRFQDQRQTGRTDRLDVYLTWPEMEGYTSENRDRFNDIRQPENLIFLQFSQSTMSRDMSGRVEPIYSHLFEGAPESGPAGLTMRHLKEGSGYAGETLLTGTMPDGSIYAVRCILPARGQPSTSADCQRDIHTGDDLSLLFRFSSRLLPQWQEMETAVRTYARQHLVQVAPPTRTPDKNTPE